MRLQVVAPRETVVDEEVTRVQVETALGSFCLLPRHVDYVTILVPGILSYETGRGEFHLAVDHGLLVKRGPVVKIAARHATRGTGLEELERVVERMLGTADEQERKTRTALARLEARLARQFGQLDPGSG
ncbi:MAG: F0F1 ATP synthase subunit epsilon [Candidatus Eremiobacterota bacterium]